MRTGLRTVQAFNALVDSEVHLARLREEALSRGKELAKRVGRCVDQLDTLDYTEANAKEAARLLGQLHQSKDRESPEA